MNDAAPAVADRLAGSRRLRTALALALAAVLVGAGLVQLAPLYDRATTVEAAATTEGTVLEADRTRNQYRVRYRYTVDGRSYESDRVFPGPYAPGGTASPEVVAQVPAVDPGERITVHYDPADPGYAWLATRDDLASKHVVYFVVAGFAAVLLLALVAVDRGLARHREGDEAAGFSGPTHGERELLSTMADVDPEDPPPEAEVERRIADALPEEAVERARGPDGDLDLSRLEGAELDTGAGSPAAEYGGGLFDGLGRVLGALKRGAVVLVVGGLVVVAAGVALVQLLAV
jgi:hypothetical protein